LYISAVRYSEGVCVVMGVMKEKGDGTRRRRRSRRRRRRRRRVI